MGFLRLFYVNLWYNILFTFLQLIYFSPDHSGPEGFRFSLRWASQYRVPIQANAGGSQNSMKTQSKLIRYMADFYRFGSILKLLLGCLICFHN